MLTNDGNSLEFAESVPMEKESAGGIRSTVYDRGRF